MKKIFGEWMGWMPVCTISSLTMLQALHQLMDQKLIRLVGEELIAPDRSALSTAMSRFSEAG